MAIRFDQATRDLLDGKNFATIATINPDGSPHTSVIWYRREEDTIVFSTTQDRRKAATSRVTRGSRSRSSTWNGPVTRSTSVGQPR